MKSLLFATALIGATLLPAAANANLLVNASFEAGPALNGQGFARGLLPTGWSSVTGIETPDILGASYNQTGAGFAQLLGSQDGSRYLDMNGANPTGALFQDVSGLAAGSVLTLSFWAGQWAQNSSGTLTATLIDAVTSATLGSTTLNFAYAPNATSSAWTQYTLTGVVGASGTVRVRFDGNSGSSARGAPGLDNVVLLAAAAPGGVPEPATWAMMLLGFGALGAVLRRTPTQGVRVRFA